MPILTTKRLHIARKHHWTISTLMQKFEFSSADELHAEILRIFGNERIAEEFWQAFSDNQKRREKKPTKTMQVVVSEDSIDATPLNQEEELHNEEFSPDASQATEGSVTSLSASCTTANILEQLRIKEAVLIEDEEKQSRILMASESLHKELVTSFMENRKQLDSLNKELEALQQTILQKKNEAIMLLEENATLHTKMKEAYSHILAGRAKLANTRMMLEIVRVDIENATKAVVYVFSNGDIEAENVTLPEIASDIGTLIQYASDGLTIGEIKTVARLLNIVAWLDSQEISYDLSIESTKVQEFFEAVKAIQP